MRYTAIKAISLDIFLDDTQTLKALGYAVSCCPTSVLAWGKWGATLHFPEDPGLRLARTEYVLAS
jgi:hypothetical protein